MFRHGEQAHLNDQVCPSTIVLYRVQSKNDYITWKFHGLKLNGKAGVLRSIAFQRGVESRVQTRWLLFALQSVWPFLPVSTLTKVLSQLTDTAASNFDVCQTSTTSPPFQFPARFVDIERSQPRRLTIGHIAVTKSSVHCHNLPRNNLTCSQIPPPNLITGL